MKNLRYGLSVIKYFIFFLTALGASALGRAQGREVIFSVTGDVPYSSGEAKTLKKQVANHNKYSPAAFLVHVGDILSGGGSCSESVYSQMKDILHGLAVPAYIVPGDNETIDCKSASSGMNFFLKHLRDLEKNACNAPATERQGARPENWAFVLDGVLFIGVDLVYSAKGVEKQAAEWVQQHFEEKESQVRAAAVFAHFDPGISSTFSKPFRSAAKAFGKPVLFVHGHGHSWSTSYPFPEKNIFRMQVNMGGSEDPVQVTVTTDVSSPAKTFLLKRKPFGKTAIPMPPCVNAGPDQTLAAATTKLQGSVNNATGAFTTTWRQMSGPGVVLFDDANALATTASFSAAGSYLLRLTAESGARQRVDDVAITVGGSLATHSLTVNTAGSGEVELNSPGGIYNAGTVVTLTAKPATGFQFSGWSGDLSGVTNPATITMNADKTVAATFAPLPEAVTHAQTASGSVANSAVITTAGKLDAANGNLYLAAISMRPKMAVQSVSGLGLTWKLVRAKCAGRNTTAVEVWMAQGTPSSDGEVSATFANAPLTAVIAVSRYSHVAVVNVIGDIVAGNTTGANTNGVCAGGVDKNAYAFDLAATKSGALIYAAVAAKSATHTPGAGYAQRVALQHLSGLNTSSVAVADQAVTSPDTIIVNGAFNGVTDWSVVALEIKPATAAPAVASASEILAKPREESMAALPNEFLLHQNYPNPFWSGATSRFAGNPGTQISFSLPQASPVNIKVYNMNGAEVATVIDEHFAAGTHAVTFRPQQFASGTYFYVMQAGVVRQVRRLMLVK